MQSILSLFASEGIMLYYDQDYFVYDTGSSEDALIKEFYYTKKPVIPLTIGKGLNTVNTLVEF